MAIINEVKCARCDRKYSGVRSRCPYCGARRIGRGKYTEDSDNAKGKMLIGLLIMAVFTVGAAIMLFSTPVDTDTAPPEETPSLSNPEDDNEPSLPVETPTPTPTPDPIPDVLTEVRSVAITYDNKVTTGFSLYTGEKLGIGLLIEPPLVVEENNMEITWESSNEDRFTVTPMMHNGNYYRATVEGIATEQGSATLKVTVGDPDNGGMSHSITIGYWRGPR